MHKGDGVSCLAALALLSLAQPVRAQGVASVNAIVRVVKTAAPGTTAFGDARLGTALPPGARVRTGGRSAAGVAFPNKSELRIDELSEVIISGATRTDVRVLGGRVLADYTRPGTVTGARATAAVRGTKIIYFENPEKDTAYVRCYEGVAYVTGPGVDLAAGNAAMTSPTTLVDPTLIDDTRNWVGKTIRVLEGPNKGQQRTVTAFDPRTGTLTLDQPLGAEAKLRQAGGPGVAYLLSSDSQADVVEIVSGEGVTVHGGRISDTYLIAPLNFAEGERYPWFIELQNGVVTRTFPGTLSHQRVEDVDFPAREGINAADGSPNFGSQQVLEGTGQLVVIIHPPTGSPGGRGLRLQSLQSMLAPAGAAGGSSLAALAGSPVLAALGVSMLRQEKGDQGGKGGEGGGGGDERFSGRVVGSPEANPGKGVWFRFEPFGIGGTDGHAEGLRVRAQSVINPLYLEFGGRAEDLDGDFRAQLSDGLAHARARSFEAMAGRQHLFLGPVNNSDIARLLGTETVDAVILKTRIPGRYQQFGGYIWNTSPLFSGGYSGGYARGEALIGEGLFGWQLLSANVAGSFLGWQADASYPVVRNTLDLYAQGGRDPFNNTLVAAGIYLSGLYQRTGVDAFAEYGMREHFFDRTQLRLRKTFAKNLFIFTFVEKQIDGPWNGGGGFEWSKRLP
jgi:hypothetical protein